MSVQQVPSLSLSHSPVNLSFFSVILFPSNRLGQYAGWRRRSSFWSMWLLLRSPPASLKRWARQAWNGTADTPETSCCVENQRRKCASLDFYYSRCILSLFFVFLQLIYLFGAQLFIGVTYPYVKKGGRLSLPESTTVHTENCIWCCICSPFELLPNKGS